MRKISAAIATVCIASLAIGAPKPAEARNGGAVAAGVIGGLAAGAIIGGATRGGYYGGSGYGYSGGPGYGYYDAPAYGYSTAPTYSGYSGSDYGGCYVQRQRVWTDYGWRIRRVRVCD